MRWSVRGVWDSLTSFSNVRLLKRGWVKGSPDAKRISPRPNGTAQTLQTALGPSKPYDHLNIGDPLRTRLSAFGLTWSLKRRSSES